MTRPLELVLGKLEKVSDSGGGSRFKALCPAHGDRSPSLSIKECDDGRVLLHCFGGCSVEAIVTSMKLTMTDLFCANTNPNRQPHIPGVSRRALSVAVEFEKMILYVAKADAAKGRHISTTDLHRAQVALQRITKSKGLL